MHTYRLEFEFESGETYGTIVTANSVSDALAIVLSQLIVRQLNSTAITRLWIFRRGN